jgi:hypothetical protein
VTPVEGEGLPPSLSTWTSATVSGSSIMAFRWLSVGSAGDVVTRYVAFGSDGGHHMDDEVMPERWDRVTREAAAGAAGALFGAVIGGPSGALVAGVVPPYVLALLDDFGGRWASHRRDAAGRVLLAAADAIEADVEEVLLQAQADPRLELLAGQALAAGAGTVFEDKIAALGRVLARGLMADDEAMLDETSMMLDALSQLEAPHVRILAIFADDANALPVARSSRAFKDPYAAAQYRWRAYEISDLRNNFPHYGIGLIGIISTLERGGMVGTVGPDMEKVFKEMQRHDGSSPFAPHGLRRAGDVRWRITPLGYEVFRVVREGGEER